MTDEVKQFTGVAASRGEEGFVVVPFRETDRTPALFIRKDIAFVNCAAGQQLAEVLRRHRREERAFILPMPGVGRGRVSPSGNNYDCGFETTNCF